MKQENTPNQEEQEKAEFLTTEKMIETALKTFEDLAANAESAHVRKLAAKKLQQYKINPAQ